jgi:dihydroorotate dehydrogenase
MMQKGQPYRPLFVKIAPDCDDAMLQAIAEVALATKLDGLIVSNTTLSRDRVAGSHHAAEAGGLSGKPLFALSTERLRKTYQLTEGKLPLIGVGGIASAEDAYVKIRAGASLVQLYTALVYQGFGLVGRINDALAKLLERDGFASVSEAVGVDVQR